MTPNKRQAVVALTDEYKDARCVLSCFGEAIALYRYQTKADKDRFVYYPVCAKAIEALLANGAIDERKVFAG